MKRRTPEGEQIAVEPGEISGLFQAPQWLRNLGIACWLLFGVAAALVGLVWLLALTQTIVLPVITAGIIAAVFGPAVDLLSRKRVPRAIGAVIVFLFIVGVGALEILICALQAYVFALLTTLYLNDAVNLH